MIPDIRHAVRQLLRSSGFTVVAVALVACWLPARRATKVDPIFAPRGD